MKKLLLSAACGAALLGGAALAADKPASDFKFTGSLVATSNYEFRGLSQTLNDGAIQFNARIDHSSGVYAGIFMSGVNFGDGDTDLETDLFAGYAFPLTDSLTLDLSAIYYTYPGSKFDALYDYVEGVAALTYSLGDSFHGATVNVKGAISPEFFGRSGTGEWLGAGFNVPVQDWISVSGNVGYQWVENNANFLLPDYFHYDIGATLAFSKFSLDVRYYGTDIDGLDEKLVGSLAFNF